MTKTKTIFIVLSVAVLVFCGAVGGFEIVRDNGFQKECVADYPQKQTKQCPRDVWELGYAVSVREEDILWQ